MRITALLACTFAVAACGDSAAPGANTSPDLSATPPDLTASSPDDGPSTSGHDFAGADLTPGPDLTPPPLSMDISWTLATADLQDGMNNGFGQSCNSKDTDGPCTGTGVWSGLSSNNMPVCLPVVTQLNFYVQNVSGGAIATTTTPCPGTDHGGNVTIKLPDPAGPFNLWANVNQTNPKTASAAWVTPFTSDASLFVTVYACGCNYPQSGSSPACASPGM